MSMIFYDCNYIIVFSFEQHEDAAIVILCNPLSQMACAHDQSEYCDWTVKCHKGEYTVCTSLCIIMVLKICFLTCCRVVIKKSVNSSAWFH